LTANNGRLIISGVNPGTAEVLQRGGLDDVLGDDGIVAATDRVLGALDIAVERGRAWVAAQRGESGGSAQPDSN
jgi:SulP family sulfate permease